MIRDFTTVNNKQLRKIFLKVPKYGEPQYTDFKQAKKDMINGIDESNAAWYQKKGVKSAVL